MTSWLQFFSPQAMRGVLLFLWVTKVLVWYLHDTDSPKKKNTIQKIMRGIDILLGNFIFMQLIGLEVFEYHFTNEMIIAGFLVAVSGLWISIHARLHLARNWSHAIDFEIKNRHELVTTGIYRYVRHPIYLGIYLTIIGTQIVAGSYLFFYFLAILPVIFYFQMKREEELLTQYFGKNYLDYMTDSNMFLPVQFFARIDFRKVLR